MNNHEHDWRPDGESFIKRTCGDECEWSPGAVPIPHDIEYPSHTKRVRRYTCHCGKSKTTSLKDSGDKQ